MGWQEREIEIKPKSVEVIRSHTLTIKPNDYLTIDGKYLVPSRLLYPPTDVPIEFLPGITIQSSWDCNKNGDSIVRIDIAGADRVDLFQEEDFDESDLDLIEFARVSGFHDIDEVAIVSTNRRDNPHGLRGPVGVEPTLVEVTVPTGPLVDDEDEDDDEDDPFLDDEDYPSSDGYGSYEIGGES